MNIFKKKLDQSGSGNLPVDPIELYQTLFHEPGFEYLRGIQEEVLSQWHAKREQKDVVVKMNTGSGKTLTGLLMLYSKLMERVGNCVYVCPDNQLVEQAVQQAKHNGIPVCTFEGYSGTFPPDFLNEKAILICNIQKIFNARSIFSREKIEIGSLLLDDAHTCISKIRDQTTISVWNHDELRGRIFELLKEALEKQSPGKFRRLEAGDPDMTMQVPYWAWVDNHKEILKIIQEFADDDDLKFKWNIISDNLLAYNCFLSGSGGMEISPIAVPYHEVASFAKAKHRFILSATFEDSVSLIKDLGISFESVTNPLVPRNRKDIGQRLILAPARFDSSLTDPVMREYLAGLAEQDYNVVVLVPSKRRGKVWKDLGADVSTPSNIDKLLKKLESSVGNLVVFVNRYDGIDLLGNMCRVLVMDGTPKYHSMDELNHASMMVSNSSLGSRRGQIIEQAIGRGVRSGSDYCTIFLLGLDLVRYFGYGKNLSFFTPVTSMQLQMGLSLLDDEDRTDPLKTIDSVTQLCLSQDDNWRRFHAQELAKVGNVESDDDVAGKLALASIEFAALQNFKRRNYEAAGEMVATKIAGRDSLRDEEKAWYFQLAAHLVYPGNKAVANDFQIKASSLSNHAFFPQLSSEYLKITKPGVQAAAVRRNISEFDRPQDLAIHLEDILTSLYYNPDITADAFEKKLAALGKFLGFQAQQPEKDLGNGPDVLWCMSDGHYLILEAKSRATHDIISRRNIQQLLHSEQWFTQTYGEGMDYTPVTLQPPRIKGENVNPSENTRVLDQASLSLLHDSIRQFVNALQSRQTSAHTDSEINLLLIQYKLDTNSFRHTYLKKIQ